MSILAIKECRDPRDIEAETENRLKIHDGNGDKNEHDSERKRDTMNYLINFKNMDWEILAQGIRSKTFIRDNQRMMLVELSENFIDNEWCTNRHVGFIIEGGITINFNGKLTEFKSGDGIFIPEGEENKHKGIIAKGERALIIFYDDRLGDM